MGSEWTFYDYVDARGVNVISGWLNGHGPRVKAKFVQRVKYLEATPPGQWKRPEVAPLAGECTGLFEIRALVANVQRRLLGFYNQDRWREATLVVGAVERGGKFEPASTCEVAQHRRHRVEVDPDRHRRLHDYGNQ